MPTESTPAQAGIQKAASDLQASRGVIMFADGTVVSNVHDDSLCEGRDYGCAIHDPKGHMKSWPLRVASRGNLERVCPHGRGHGDPSDEQYWFEEHGITVMHGCSCGCCMSPDDGD